MKILTVEDNEINARLIDHILQNLDFDFENQVAEDAQKALALTSKTQFDLILMDINLGNGLMDGTEVMSILKKKNEYKHVPMYAVTCYSLPGDHERFLDSGFDRFFSKPVNHNELLKAITEDKLKA